MRMCQIGLGNWGKNHARILGEMKREGLVDEIYYFDLNTELMNQTAKLFDGKIVESLDSLDVDAVDIVVPSDLHYTLAKPFVETGVKTLIEKPFTDKEADALDLIDISSSPNSSIMVGHIFRFHNAVKYSKELIEKGTIGEMKKIDIRRLAFGIPRIDNGVIFSLAIHDLDLFCYYNNEKLPNSILTSSSTIHGPTEDHAFIQVQYDDSVGIAEESWMSPSVNKTRTCGVQGTSGEILVNFMKPGEVVVNSKYISDHIVNDGNFNYTIPFSEPLKAELLHFVEQSKQNKAYDVGPEIGLRGVKLCLAALESAKLNKRIYFD